jgi:hypothetical protein
VTVELTATVDGVDDKPAALTVRAEYTFQNMKRTGSVTLTWSGIGNVFHGTLGPFDEKKKNDKIDIQFFAVDDSGNSAGPVPQKPRRIFYRDC